MLFFKTKKPILNETRNEAQDNVDLQIINKMNQEFAISLDTCSKPVRGKVTSENHRKEPKKGLFFGSFL